MHYSIYHDNIISTSRFITENLIKSAHFPSTVRTTPNRFKNYFIGELTHRIKPHFDSIETTSSGILPKSKTLNNFRYHYSYKIKVKKNDCTFTDFPKLIHRTLPSKSINGWTTTKNIRLVKNNDKYNFDIYYKELVFPYCKPKVINHNIINYNKLVIPKNKNFETIRNNKRKRLFLKSLTKLHLLINKSNEIKKSVNNNI